MVYGFAFIEHCVTFEQSLAESLILAVCKVLDRREHVKRMLSFLSVNRCDCVRHKVAESPKRPDISLRSQLEQLQMILCPTLLLVQVSVKSALTIQLEIVIKLFRQ